MDTLSLLGLLVAFGGVLIGQMLEGGAPDILFQGAAFLIVCGGTLGAVMLQSSFKVFVNGIKMGRWVFFTPKLSPQRLVSQITTWSSLARKEGILAPRIASNDKPGSLCEKRNAVAGGWQQRRKNPRGDGNR